MSAAAIDLLVAGIIASSGICPDRAMSVSCWMDERPIDHPQPNALSRSRIGHEVQQFGVLGENICRQMRYARLDATQRHWNVHDRRDIPRSTAISALGPQAMFRKSQAAVIRRLAHSSAILRIGRVQRSEQRRHHHLALVPATRARNECDAIASGAGKAFAASPSKCMRPTLRN